MWPIPTPPRQHAWGCGPAWTFLPLAGHNRRAWAVALWPLPRCNPVPFPEKPGLFLPGREANTPTARAPVSELSPRQGWNRNLGLAPRTLSLPPFRTGGVGDTYTGPIRGSVAKPQSPGKQARPSGKLSPLLSVSGPSGSARLPAASLRWELGPPASRGACRCSLA